MAERHASRSYIIKPFTMEDWRALWVVHLAQLADQGVLLDPEEVPDGPDPNTPDEHGEWDLEYPDKVYLQGAGGLWLAWEGELPIGSVAGQDIDGAVELRRMYVRPNYRRQGVATALVRALIDHSRSQGVRAIELWTGPDGDGARFYPTLGFRRTAGPGPEFTGDEAGRNRYRPSPEEIRLRLDVAAEKPVGP